MRGFRLSSSADREDSLSGRHRESSARFLPTADGALRVAESADRLIAWATAMKVRALARVEEAIGEESPRRQENQPVRFGGDETHALAVAEVSTACAALRRHRSTLLHDAADLTTSQWQVLEAVEAGEISEAHARVILDQARSLPAEQAEQFSTVALRRTRTRQGRLRTPSELRAFLRRLRECLHPESLTARKAAARRERGVWFTAEPDGMCTLTARLAAETGMAIFNGLDARRTAGVCPGRRAHRPFRTGLPPSRRFRACTVSGHRMLSELRADALIQRLLGGSDGSGAGAFRAEVLVTIPVGLVLAPLAQARPHRIRPGRPNAPRLSSKATAPSMLPPPGAWRPSRPPGSGSSPTAPPARRSAWAAQPTGRRKRCAGTCIARDGTCRFPGCTRRATACEPDHTIEWHDGGTTEPGNLAMLCRKHHALKSIGAWTYSHTSPTGDLKWRSPLGREYSTEPTQLDQPHHPPRQPDPPPF